VTAAVAPPLRPTLATKVAWNGAANAVASAGAAVAGILAARSLGAAGMGHLAFLLWTMETVALVVQFGMARTLTRFVAETGSAGLGLWMGRRLLLLTAAGAALFLVAAPGLGRASFGAPALAVGAILFCARGADAVGRAYLAGLQDFRRLARLNVASGLLLVAGVGAGGALYGLPGVLAGYVAAALAGCRVTAAAFRAASPEPPDEAMRRRVRRFAGWLWVGAILSIFTWSQLEIVFLERLASAEAVGHFAAGVRVTRLATIVPLMLGGAFVPHFAERIGADDHGAVRAGYAAGTRAVALLLFPLSLGLAATAPVVVPLLYGAEFVAAVPVAMVLCGVAALSVNSVGASLILGAGKSHVRVVWSAAAAVAMVALLWAVVPAHGAWGAAWVRLGVRAAIVLAAMFYVGRFLRAPVPVAALARILAAALVCGAAAWAVVWAWPLARALPLAVAAGAAAYVAALRALRAVHPEDAAAFRRFAGRAPRPLRRPMRAVVGLAEGRR